MSFDMSQFYQVFFEETEEHLALLESLLVRLDPAHPDAADIAEIFRAAHSIKGSSATFGFNDMAEVTHVMESLLDGVRRGEIRVERGMVDACLAAVDVLANLLAAHRGEDKADRGAAAAVRRRLEAAHAAARAAAEGGVPLEDAGQARAEGGAAAYELRFAVSRLIAGSEVLVDNMLQELGALGELVVLQRPGPGDAGGEWRLRLTSGRPEDALHEVLDLVTEPGSLVLERSAPTPYAAAVRPSVPLAVADHGHAASGAVVEEAEDGSYGFFVPVGPGGTVGTVAADSGAASSPQPTSAAGVGEPKPAGRGGGESSIRVGVDKVDQMMNLVGELVITRSMLEEVADQAAPGLSMRLAAGLAQLERNTRALQETVMSIRMVPVSTVFSRFPRLVYELSERLGKRVELRLEGEHTELDKGLVERIADPLTHLVRNSLDHGIEAPEARRAVGKPETGTITLRASHQGGHIVIEACDDGAGLDRARILARAAECGLAVGEGMSDAEVWQLIFEPGFSTAATVTELSGRGVGMDVVKRGVAVLGGRIDVDSQPGVGTRVTVRLPLTLALLEGMIVAVGSEQYVVPLNTVVESLQPRPEMIRSVGGVRRMIQVRDEFLPVVGLGERFQVPGAGREWTAGVMVLVEASGARVALFVDALVGRQQVVIKSLEANFRRVAGFSGATILGDGRVALILDVASVAGGARRGLVAVA